MPEARAALRVAKVPRKAGLLMEMGGNAFTCTLNPETLAISSGRLPDAEEAQSARVAFEERVRLLRECCKVLDMIFEKFLTIRTGSGWEGRVSDLSRWIRQGENRTAVIV
jgi:hypothetical protein